MNGVSMFGKKEKDKFSIVWDVIFYVNLISLCNMYFPCMRLLKMMPLL